MSLFNRLRGKVKNIQNKSLLEGIVAGCVWVSAADGDIDDAEISKMLQVIESNPDLQHFGSEIGKAVNEMSKAFAVSPQVGRIQAERKISTVFNGTDDDRLFVVAAILSVVSADGKVSPEEDKVVQTIAKKLRVNLDQFA